MTATTITDLAEAAYQRMLANRESYYDPIVRVFGYYLMRGADADDDGEALDRAQDWLDHFPDIAALNAYEQDIIHDGALELLFQSLAPSALRDHLAMWFSEGAPS